MRRNWALRRLVRIQHWDSLDQDQRIAQLSRGVWFFQFCSGREEEFFGGHSTLPWLHIFAFHWSELFARAQRNCLHVRRSKSLSLLSSLPSRFYISPSFPSRLMEPIEIKVLDADNEVVRGNGEYETTQTFGRKPDNVTVFHERFHSTRVCVHWAHA